MPQIQILNPLDIPDWDELLLTADHYSIFHSTAWVRVLSESYHFNPLYFSQISNNRLEALFPVMEIKSKIAGTRGVSLPFADYCEPIITPPFRLQEGFDQVADYGREMGWKYLVMKGWELPVSSSNTSVCYRHILPLTSDAADLFSKFRSSTQRNIRKALSYELKMTTGNSIDYIKHYYYLHCLTRREHGLPPQPFYFFQNLHKHIISKGIGSVVLASYNNRYIAGAIFFLTKPYALFKYGASDKKYQHLRPNNLIFWEVIKNLCQQGYTQLCFGITESNNTGLMQFKSGWATDVAIVSRAKYDFRKDSFVTYNSKVTGEYNAFFRKLPLLLLKLSGRLLYKHMG
jgi:hypothetical protein